MSLAGDLLEQAAHLAARDVGRPRQASLRRAISTAYYSLFHLIVEDGASLLVRRAQLRPVIARCFDHKNLRSTAEAICEAYRGPKGPQGLRPFLRLPVSDELAAVCEAFVNLYENRLRADYDTRQKFTRAGTAIILSSAATAHAKWRGERGTYNAQVFVLSAAKLIVVRS